jgi:hypothetical protein
MGGEFTGSSTRRSPRYPITAPVRFRTEDGEWVEGTTVNICARGLLLRTRFVVMPPTSLQLRIALTGDSASGAHVACSGHVVRAEQPPDIDEALVAVTIDDFQLRPAARRAEPTNAR